MVADTGDTDSGLGRFFAGAHRHRFDILLGALTLLLLSTPVAHLVGPFSHPVLTRAAVTLVFTAMLLSAAFAVCRSRVTVIIGLSLAVPAILLSGVRLLVAWDGIVIAQHVLSILFLGYVIAVILKFLFTTDRVTFNMIWASLCVYLLVGVLWANAYSLIDVLEPGSFAFASAEDRAAGRMQFGGGHSLFPIYYSFVTLTTLGYGDIVPTSSPARMFAAVEAVMGQVYLAVLVARLVGLHIAQSAKNAQWTPDPSEEHECSEDR